MIRRFCLLIVFSFTTALGDAPSHAQPLVEQVPAGTLVYVGWAGAGTDTTRNAYLQSTLHDLIATMPEGALPTAIEGLSRAVSMQAEEEPQVGEVMDVMQPLLRATWSSPAAMYVLAPADAAQPGDGPGVVVMWSPSAADRPALLEAVRGWVERVDDEDLTMAATEERVTLLYNAPAAGAGGAGVAGAIDGLLGDEAGGLAQSEGYATVMRGLGVAGDADEGGASPLITTYVDLPALLDLLRGSLEEQGGTPEVLAVMDALKLDRIGPTGYAASFDGKDWMSRVFLSAPAPREGLAAMLDAPTLEDEHLALVPRGALWLAAGTFDLGKAVDLTRESAQAIGPDAADQFEQALAQASGMLGVNVEERLLRGLGPAWLAYAAPGALGDSPLGLTIVNPLHDAEGVDMALRSLEAIGNAVMAQQMQEEDIQLRFHTVQRDGITLHQIPLFFITPTWAVHDGRLIVGLYPATVVAAAEGVGAGGSLIDGEAFGKATPEAEGRVTAVSYLDLPRAAELNYGSLVMLEALATGWASASTGQPVPTFLPPLSQLMPHLRPAGATAWVDDSGFFIHSTSPFPGSTLLNPTGSGGIALASGGVGVLLPALGAARRTARQMTDGTQASSIHEAMYAEAQAQQPPADGGDKPLIDDIGKLILGQYTAPDFTVSPASDTKVPADIGTWPLEAQADWVRANADYIIVPGLIEDYETAKVALFLRPGIYNEPGEPGRGTVTFNDNSTHFEADYDLIEQQLIEQTGMTMDELIARQEALASPETP